MIPLRKQFTCLPPKTEVRVAAETQNNDAALNYAIAWETMINYIRQAEFNYKSQIAGCTKNNAYPPKVNSILHNVKQMAFCLIDKDRIKESDFQDLIDEIQTIKMLVDKQITFEELEQEDNQ